MLGGGKEKRQINFNRSKRHVHKLKRHSIRERRQLLDVDQRLVLARVWRRQWRLTKRGRERQQLNLRYEISFDFDRRQLRHPLVQLFHKYWKQLLKDLQACRCWLGFCCDGPRKTFMLKEVMANWWRSPKWSVYLYPKMFNFYFSLSRKQMSDCSTKNDSNTKTWTNCQRFFFWFSGCCWIGIPYDHHKNINHWTSSKSK